MLASIQDMLKDVFSELSIPVYLLNQDGQSLIYKHADRFRMPPDLQENQALTFNGYLFFALPGYHSLTLAIKDRPGANDLLLLTSHMIQAALMAQGVSEDANNAYKRLLTGSLGQTEYQNLLKSEKLIENLPRCAMLMRVPGLKGGSAKAVLQELLPLQDEDILIGLDGISAVLARSLTDSTPQDLPEYAMALQDTFQNELGLQAVIGIGETVNLLADLPISYQQAAHAMEIGIAFRPNEQIFEHQSLLLERFVADTPIDLANGYANSLFNRKTTRLFNEEMLTTIEVFIQKNLNLTDAAKQLFIHRNTLVYRLDKIKQQSGLDLRNFHDAMTFKLLYDLKKIAKAKGRKILPSDQ